MYWTLELAMSKLEDTSYLLTKEELIDFAIRSGLYGGLKTYKN